MLMKSKTNCETNILSLVSQNLDNFYQIQTKCYRNSDTVFFFPILWTKRGLTSSGHRKTGGTPDREKKRRWPSQFNKKKQFQKAHEVHIPLAGNWTEPSASNAVRHKQPEPKHKLKQDTRGRRRWTTRKKPASHQPPGQATSLNPSPEAGGLD
jgi:hypothetical protein